jgi:hypothetical protein
LRFFGRLSLEENRPRAGPVGRAVTPQPPVTHINLIQNWTEELKAKVPVGK